MRNAEILIVDDSAADRASIRIAFERLGLPLKLHFAANAESALTMLREDADGRSPCNPHMLMVDVKMPGLSGLDLLKRLKADHKLLRLPVIMLSGSDDQSDVKAAYVLQASGYIRKPPDVVGLAEMADIVGRLCASVLAFPER
jgi:two-component system response regulator